jgi:hypothetical protein
MALVERVGQVPLVAAPGSARLAVGVILPSLRFVENFSFRRADLSTGLGLPSPPVDKPGWLV